jgi:hypothetical protein
VSRWSEFEQEQPELAGEVRRRLDAHIHKVMATVRADGSPRLCGSEVTFAEGDLWLAGMVGARRFADLRRDPRVAIHSCPEDMPGWSGDSRLAGTAVEVTDPETLAMIASVGTEPPGPFELFRVDVTEAVSVRMAEGGQSILVESWRQGRGLTRAERA